MLRPVHFQILANDVERAAKFYSDVFNWDIKKWEGGDYWMVMTGEKEQPGIDGGLMKHTEAPAKGGANAFILTISVPDYDEYHEKILKAGGKVMSEKHEIPDVGFHGDYFDCEGNMFSILEPTGLM